MSMNKKLLIIGCLLGACAGFNMNMPAYCGFQEHYTLAQQHFFNARYASAIDEALMLEDKYKAGMTASVDEELAELKKELGI